jgi:hypothetical protein
VDVSIADPRGRVWSIRVRRLVPPPFPGFGSASDAIAPIGLLDLVWPVVLPPLAYVGQLVVFGSRSCVQLLRDRFVVVAETDRERWRWGVASRSQATRLLGEVAAAVRDGAELPPFGGFESRASRKALTESDVAYRRGSGHVRVVPRRRP